jgi:O-antigen ligase
VVIFSLTVLILPRPAGEGVKLERQSTVLSRYQNWQQGLLVARDHPLLGVGFNLYRYSARDYGFLDKLRWQYSHAGAGVDNSLIFVLATTGISGLLAFAYLLFSWLKWGLEGKVRLVFAAVLGATLVHGFFNNTLFYSFVMLQIWVILGFIESK